MTKNEIEAQIKYHEDYIRWYCRNKKHLAKLHRRDIKELKQKLKDAA